MLALLGLSRRLGALIRQATTELVLTDRRVIYKTGLFQRHTMEMNRSKVETVGVDQSVLGRLLNYGTVIVRGTGGSFEPIRQIERPADLPQPHHGRLMPRSAPLRRGSRGLRLPAAPGEAATGNRRRAVDRAVGGHRRGQHPGTARADDQAAGGQAMPADPRR